MSRRAIPRLDRPRARFTVQGVDPRSFAVALVRPCALWQGDGQAGTNPKERFADNLIGTAPQKAAMPFAAYGTT